MLLGCPDNYAASYGYTSAQLTAEILRRAGDNLTRENLLRQANSIKDLNLPMMMPNVKINISADDHYPIKDATIIRFDGSKWTAVAH